MTHIENLKEGDVITVVKDKMLSPEVQVKYFGQPLKVVLIELPFLVAVDLKREKIIFDVRGFDFQKMSKKYWNVCSGGMKIEDEVRENDDGWERCVNCGTRMRQTFVGDRWFFVCPECGKLGDPVQV